MAELMTTRYNRLLEEDCLVYFRKYSGAKQKMLLDEFKQLISDMGENLSSSVIKLTFKSITSDDVITQQQFTKWYFTGMHLSTGIQRGLLKIYGHKLTIGQAISMAAIGKQKAAETKIKKNHANVSFRSNENPGIQLNSKVWIGGEASKLVHDLD